MSTIKLSRLSLRTVFSLLLATLMWLAISVVFKELVSADHQTGTGDVVCDTSGCSQVIRPTLGSCISAPGQSSSGCIIQPQVPGPDGRCIGVGRDGVCYVPVEPEAGVVCEQVRVTLSGGECLVEHEFSDGTKCSSNSSGLFQDDTFECNVLFVPDNATENCIVQNADGLCYLPVNPPDGEDCIPVNGKCFIESDQDAQTCADGVVINNNCLVEFDPSNPVLDIDSVDPGGQDSTPVLEPSENVCNSEYLLGIIPPWHKYLECKPDGSPIDASGDSSEDGWSKLIPIGFAVAEALFALSIIAAIIMFMVGSIGVMTSGGTSDKLAKARSTLQNATAGLIFAIMASRVVNYVASSIYISNGGNSLSIGVILKVIIQIGAAIAVLLIGKSALSYIVSGGESGKVTNAKNSLLFAVIGLFLLISSYTLISYIISVV